MNQIPRDPVMLLSFVNTKLRDHYPSLQELCAALDVEQKAVTDALGVIGYVYDQAENRFR